jgi:hypothetical protein
MAFGDNILAREGVERTEYKSYAEVPVYKKRWFFIVAVLVFIPAGIYLALASDIYYDSGVGVVKFTKSRRLSIAGAWAILLAYNLFRAYAT